MKLLLTVGALPAATSTQALAWDDEGHRIVCEIAYHEAAAATRMKIDKLLAGRLTGSRKRTAVAHSA
ncbi:MAG: hypothetical protein WAS21_01985 [Geminicoccaceae bacterium]